MTGVLYSIIPYTYHISQEKHSGFTLETFGRTLTTCVIAIYTVHSDLHDRNIGRIVFSVRIRRFSVDGRAKRINIYAFVDLPGLMWTGQGNEMATGSEKLA